LIQDTEIINAVDRAVDEAQTIEAGRDLVITEPRLRVLDAALWTHAKYGASTPRGEVPVPQGETDEVG